MLLKPDSPAIRGTPLTSDTDKAHVARGKKFQQTGQAYAHEHATRPATIGFAVVSSPLALAAWWVLSLFQSMVWRWGLSRIGEKIIDSWSSEVPTPLLMQWLTLFWLTQSFPTSIYMYRHFMTLDFTRASTPEEVQDFTKPLSGLKVGKKIGYSTFPKEIFPVPKVWAEKTGDLVFYRLNKEGGSRLK
jgi:microsomal epoxide hydrolase